MILPVHVSSATKIRPGLLTFLAKHAQETLIIIAVHAIPAPSYISASVSALVRHITTRISPHLPASIVGLVLLIPIHVLHAHP